MFASIFQAILFGIVEGITEWLPISSTGHLMLLDEIVPLAVSPGFYDTFLVVIQLGAILAVIVLYFHKLNPFSPRKSTEQKHETWGIWAKVVVGSIPAAIVGLLLDDWVEEHIMNSESLAAIVVACALIIYGIIFIVIEQYRRRKIARLSTPVRGRHARIIPIQSLQDSRGGGQPGTQENSDASLVRRGEKASLDPAEIDGSSAISKVNSFDELGYGRAFIIGIFQSLAIIPGTSRSGSIIIGSLVVGTSRTIATEFAFFLAIPIMLGWSLLKFFRHGLDYTANEWIIFAVGIVTAFLVSVVAIKFLISYIKRNDFTIFGVYRIIIGIIVLVVFSLAL